MYLRMSDKMVFHIYNLIILHDSIDSLYSVGLFVNMTMRIRVADNVMNFLTS